jgi:hypothetical protein
MRSTGRKAAAARQMLALKANRQEEAALSK